MQLQSGIYTKLGSLYRKIDDELFKEAKYFNNILLKDHMDEKMIVFLSDDLGDLSKIDRDIDWFFHGCKNIIEVHAANYKYDFIFRFSECPDLRNVFLPNNLTAWHPTAFWKTPSLEGVHIGKSNKKFKTIDGVLYSKNEKELYFLPANHDFKISEKTSVLREYALSSYAHEHKRLTIPNGIKALLEHACDNSKEIFLPSTIKNVTMNCVNWHEDESDTVTIYCPENVEKIFKEKLADFTLRHINFKRPTLDNLIENYSFTDVNNLIQTYGDIER